MCGVVAALGKGSEFEQMVTQATSLLRHRGIRNRIEFGPAGGIGHVRLPIVGLGKEHDQPMRRGSHLVGFVGELLDFKEHYPGAECDAPVVADTWERVGPWGFRKHDGFWGIVVLDEVLGVLHVLTDYLAQKPMYYRTDCGAAASEPDALLPFGEVTLDQVYLSACIKWGYCPDVTRTPYNEIKHVLPGEHVILDKRGVFQRKIVDELTPLPWNAGNPMIADELEAAVKRRVLSSDVPVACLLSGGVDSALVYEMAEKHANIKAYCATEKNDQSDYWNAVRVVHGNVTAFLDSQPAGLRDSPRHVIYDDVSVLEALKVMQEPIDLGSLRPQVALSRAIPETVCLTGDGADEVFGGYQRSQRYDSQWTDVFQELPAWHMPRLDRVMMKNRIEVRSPFLARNVVRLALSLPHELRKDKNYLRHIALHYLPTSIAQAPKKALRTSEIAHDREAYSYMLVTMFKQKFGEANGTTPKIDDYTGPY